MYGIFLKLDFSDIGLILKKVVVNMSKESNFIRTIKTAIPEEMEYSVFINSDKDKVKFITKSASFLFKLIRNVSSPGVISSS